ncbi:Hint domain-containing protein [Shimia abyssi]|uniref:Hint domain-containing protein n=1 Tax=Shimia abyssi TaxID=1662395 RepID=A0A2P8ESZ8_9RHOB|nr:Hint domain-containing protein [Shimia abyssi]PSL12574.1 Hint domain-containing protein [Shimia abyssi]
MPETIYVTIDGSQDYKGVHYVEVDNYASTSISGSQDVFLTDGGDITELDISKMGKGDGQSDTFNFDLSQFDDDFSVTIKSEGPEDSFIVDGATAYSVNSGVYTIEYLGSDGHTHTMTVDPGHASVVVNYASDGVISGSAGDDDIDETYTGDPHGDMVDGADGNPDIIDGQGGNDNIFGRAGSDTIYGGSGSDTIEGNGGADLIYGDRTYDTQYTSQSISINNASFEDDAVGEDDYINGTLSGWTINGSDSGVWNPTSASIDVGTVTDQNVAYLYDDGDRISQLLSQTYQDGNTYQFGLDIGDSYEGSANFTVNIYAGSTVIGTYTGDTGDEDRLDSLTVSSDGFSDPSLNGQPLTIEIVMNTGGVLSVDAVTGEVLTPIDPDETPGAADLLSGGAGSDTIDGGVGNDTISGGNDDDTILMSKGSDTVAGGSGQDTYDANSGSGAPGETINVSIDGSGPQSGSGTVTKTVDGSTDTLTGIEEIVAGEDSAEADTIVVEGIVDYWQVSGLDDNSVGVFTPNFGPTGPISFGGPGDPTLSELLSSSYDPGTGTVHPFGTFQITSGDESGTVGDISFQNFETIEFSTVCFAPGTLIKTPFGAKKVETLKPGDLVATADHGFQEIRWIHTDEEAIDGENSYPILIKAGALGVNFPHTDLVVSSQHRILVGEAGQLEHVFKEPALVPAKGLITLPGIRKMRGKKQVDWWHFALDGHEVVEANGAQAESLLIGKMVLNALDATERICLHSMFGFIEGDDAGLNGPPARELLGAGKAKRKIKLAKQLRDYRRLAKSGISGGAGCSDQSNPIGEAS